MTLAKKFSGAINVASVGQTDPCLYGCIAGIGAAAVVTIGISIFHNARYGWGTLGAIRILDVDGNDKDVAYEDPTYDPERLKKAAYVARGITLFLFLSLFIIWPLRYVPFHADRKEQALILNIAFTARRTSSLRSSSLAGSLFLYSGHG